ncbi:hypothetical protein KS4_05170 [Poriferisphaera corsica]|uniref:Uncharacterized protein n=1 Tax=Poriferisphaera corsica TaxID=2528020 RepID=A0A517YQJ4_9BACT|nr:hypothetical protein [Poriferisphaera corsica]QDU32485.1 hypothetical protein KS4_05170 [Poriferisphaera corsica]
MVEVNLIFGWAWVMVGIFTGAVIGMFFAREDFMGGYGSWRRRMVRLGHIAFMGMAAVNIGFALTVKVFGVSGWGINISGASLIIGGIGMPVICLLSAWRKSWRHAFALPVSMLLIGIGSLLLWLVVAIY